MHIHHHIDISAFYDSKPASFLYLGKKRYQNKLENVSTYENWEVVIKYLFSNAKENTDLFNHEAVLIEDCESKKHLTFTVAILA